MSEIGLDLANAGEQDPVGHALTGGSIANVGGVLGAPVVLDNGLAALALITVRIEIT
jgi:hypothetical protein